MHSSRHSEQIAAVPPQTSKPLPPLSPTLRTVCWQQPPPPLKSKLDAARGPDWCATESVSLVQLEADKRGHGATLSLPPCSLHCAARSRSDRTSCRAAVGARRTRSGVRRPGARATLLGSVGLRVSKIEGWGYSAAIGVTPGGWPAWPASPPTARAAQRNRQVVY